MTKRVSVAVVPLLVNVLDRASVCVLGRRENVGDGSAFGTAELDRLLGKLSPLFIRVFKRAKRSLTRRRKEADQSQQRCSNCGCD